MQSSPDVQGFRLPEDPNPPMICVQFNIPNEPAHISAFLGALYDLTLWNSWQRDAAHRGIIASQIWKRIWIDLISRPFGCQQSITVGAGGGDETLIRQNPDNPCELQTSIDGQLWCTFADFSLCTPAAPQPGQGTPQPAPGGGTTCSRGILSSQSPWLLPYPVNSGDVLELTSASGAANDGTFSIWRCQDGLEFFAGTCTGVGYLDGSDPLPSVNHMRLIWNIAGVYYDAIAGPVTVPGGVVNGIATLQVNDSILSDNSGNFQISACLTNNVVPNWSHCWLGGKGAIGMQLPPQTQIWGSYNTPLDRIESQDSGGGTSENASVDVPFAGTVTHIKFDVIYDNDGPSGAAGCGIATDANNPGTQNLYSVLTPVGAGTFTVEWFGSQAIATRVRLFASAIKTVVGSTKITNVQLNGVGSSPFGANNC